MANTKLPAGPACRKDDHLLQLSMWKLTETTLKTRFTCRPAYPACQLAEFTIQAEFSKPTFSFFNRKKHFDFMKKVKIMLLSLALFAVVGGALAFKVKFNKTFCTTDAYFDSAKGFYCTYSFVDPVVGLTTTGADCIDQPLIQSTYTIASGVKTICTTTIQGQDCEDLTCSVPVNTIDTDL